MIFPPRIIVYDLDGTLVDAFRDIWSNLNTVFAKHGLKPVAFEQVRSAVGDGVRMLVRRCLGSEELHLFDEIHPEYLDHYEKHPGDQMQLYPNVIEILGKVRGFGITQAILTNKPIGPARATCDRMKLTDRVDGIWGEVPGEPRKPNPASLNRILRHFQVQPAEAVMVGDSINDLETARGAGTRFIGVTWGQMTRERFEREKAGNLIDSMCELPHSFQTLAGFANP